MLKIIDSHVHFWDPGFLRYSWLDTIPKLNRPFLTDHVPMDDNAWKVEGIVFVQADCAPTQSLAEVEWVSGLAANDARVRGIIGFAPLEQGEESRPILASLKQNPLVKGVRRLIQDESAGFSTQAAFVAGVRALAEFNFSFDLCIRHHQLAEVVQLVRQVPKVRFVLDHCGKPDIKHHLLEPWRTQLAELADFPNVFCKLSGLVSEADQEHWQPADLRLYIQHVLNVFGTDRVMFGSDAPVLYLASTYARWLQTVLEATAHLTPHEQRKLWHDNVAAFYHL